MSAASTLANEHSLITVNSIVGFATCTGTHFFKPAQIIRCEARSNYTCFHLVNEKVLVVAKTLGEYESTLPSQFFLRIHRSSIINITHIIKQDRLGNLWLSDGSYLAVSKRRKAVVVKALKPFIH